MRTLLVSLLASLALAVPTGVPAPPSDWPQEATWPAGNRVVREFDPPEADWLPGHRGVDLAGVVGTTVRAAAAGVVTFAGELAGRGVVVVSHGALRTTYEPVTPTVAVGAEVGLGQQIGVVASGHLSPAPTCALACLHWGLRRGDEYLNPLLLVGAVPEVRLVAGQPTGTPDGNGAWPAGAVGAGPPAGVSPLRPSGAPAGTLRGAVPT